jgi:hypothetical protein
MGNKFHRRLPLRGHDGRVLPSSPGNEDHPRYHIWSIVVLQGSEIHSVSQKETMRKSLEQRIGRDFPISQKTGFDERIYF